ncbi:peptide chain release factor N(5)-glutamine methyltransferase [Celerinatantimonas sp. YJH-8]|uniref:peptide chain release factor N(5)-glutamine methyltransferase n=1 Tax=Celerinatantimonas sp. YJH-8 TaxID=3228714 RepID=UPI0038C0CF28
MTFNLSIEQALQFAGSALISSDSARLDARVLLGHVLGKPPVYLMTWPERSLTESQWQAYQQLLKRRQSGEPIAYIIGEREFWSLPFYVAPCTLIPRPDTEVLVELALERLSPQARLLDLGTGTGAIAIALTHERPDLMTTAVDIREDALAIARRNGERNQVSVDWRLSSWFDALSGCKFDMIVSNPPYIDPLDEHLQQGDVRFEPKSALVAEAHGLADLFTIIDAAPAYLNEGGWLLLEHGYQQSEPLLEYLAKPGWHQVQTCCDYAGQPRVTLGQYRVK